MRFLFIILFFTPVCTLAQTDSLVFTFLDSVREVSISQQTSFAKQIEGKRVSRIKIQAFILRDASISKSRLKLEYRMRSIKNLCLSHAIYENIIFEKRKITDDPSLANRINIYFEFVEPKKGKVIFKTETVQITEKDPTKRSMPQVSKKEVSQRPKTKAKKKKPKKKEPTSVKKYGLLKIEDFKKGARIVIPELLFEATRHTFYRTSLRSLKTLLAIMQDKPNMHIRLEGHICCKSNGEDGMDFQTNTSNLSENRAKEVCLYLIRNGIDPNRLTYVGFGSKRKLVEDHGSAIKGLVNRRVEVFVVSE